MRVSNAMERQVAFIQNGRISLVRSGCGRSVEGPITREIASSNYWYMACDISIKAGLAPVGLDINSESNNLAPFDIQYLQSREGLDVLPRIWGP